MKRLNGVGIVTQRNVTVMSLWVSCAVARSSFSPWITIVLYVSRNSTRAAYLATDQAGTTGSVRAGLVDLTITKLQLDARKGLSHAQVSVKLWNHPGVPRSVASDRPSGFGGGHDLEGGGNNICTVLEGKASIWRR